MGVPSFTTWLRRTYPEAFSEVRAPRAYDHVYVDLPSTLHDVSRKARSKAGLHAGLHARLDALLAAAAPRRSMLLALDGPAPLAKLLEQRRRRRRAADKERRDSEEADAAAARAAPAGGAPPRRRRHADLTPLSLTTGSVLMLELHSSLAYWVCRRLADPAGRALRFELSDSTVKGEAELKILSRLMHPEGGEPLDVAAAAMRGGDDSDVESILVVGGDSDLLLMAAASGARGVVVCEAAHEAGDARARSPPVAFDCDALAATWRGAHLLPGAPAADAAALALDLALLAVMASSNDYLPGLAGLRLGGRRRGGAWALYHRMRAEPRWAGQFLVARGAGGGAAAAATGAALNAPMLAALLRRHRAERAAATRRGAAAGTAHTAADDEGAAGADEARDFADAAADEEARGATDASADAESSLDADDALSSSTASDLDAAGGTNDGNAAAYVEGLEWVLGMYATGSVRDYRYAFFGGPPRLGALIAHLEALAAAPARAATAGGVGAGGGGGGGEEEPADARLARHWRQLEPLTPAACALALLPALGRRHAATALRHLFDAGSPLYPLYAVCGECRAASDAARAVSKDLEGVKARLFALAKAPAAGAAGTPEGEEDAAAATERLERVQDRLRATLRELSKTQRDHVAAAHPPTPFPAAELEAAVAAVPIGAYPRRERRLARFGREMAYTWAGEAAAAAVEAAEAAVAAAAEAGDGAEAAAAPALAPARADPTPAWLYDAASFAAAYPRLADPAVLRAAARLSREVLPLRPYMLPGGGAAQFRHVGGAPGWQPPAARARPAAAAAAFAGAGRPLSTGARAAVRLAARAIAPRLRGALRF
jgi:hypothetical protein